MRGADIATESAYHAAIDSARSQHAKYSELQATTDFARWLKFRERAGEARAILTEIYEWFTEGFDTPALSEAKVVLDEISHS